MCYGGCWVVPAFELGFVIIVLVSLISLRVE